MTLVETAIALAKEAPLAPHKNRGATFNGLRSIAYHLSKLTDRGRFILPQKQLSKVFNVSQQTIEKRIAALKNDKVIVRVEKSRSGRASRYTFIEPITANSDELTPINAD